MDGLMLRRRIMAAAFATPLPYDAEVEYIGSDGNHNQFVVTDYTPVVGDEVYVEFENTEQITNTQSVFSAGNGNYQLIFLIGTSASGAYIKYFATGAAALLAYPYSSLNVWHTLTVSSAGVFSIDNNYVATSATPFEALDGNETNLFLFKLRNNTSPFLGNIRKFRITNGGQTKLDLIPVRIGQVGYMYDRISGSFYGNSGTGDFIVGPDK